MGSAQVALLCMVMLEAGCTKAAGIISGMEALMVADRPARIFEAQQDLAAQQPDLAEVALAATVLAPLQEALSPQQPDFAEVLLAAMVFAPLHEALSPQQPDLADVLLAATVFAPLQEALPLQQPDFAEVVLAAMVWTPDLSEQEDLSAQVDFASQEFALARSALTTMRTLGALHWARSPSGQQPSPEWFAASTAEVAFTPESQDPNMEHKDLPVTVA